MSETQLLQSDERGIVEAARLLREGQLVAFPTETVYGLGADARDGEAVAGIYEAKGRPSFNPLIVHVPSLTEAERLVELPPILENLGKAFWPGPLTLVAPMRADAGLSDLVSAGLPTVAVRVPANPLAKALLQNFGAPVAAPSANRSGQISPTTASHVFEGMEGRVSAILDGGACAVGLESTIIGGRDGAAVLLRPGGLPKEAVEKAIGQSLLAPSSGKIEAPGQLLSHYAPNARLQLNVLTPSTDFAYLAFGNVSGLNNCLDLSGSGDLREAAARLFSHLRKLDALVAEKGLAGIAVAPIPTLGLGLAINDRLIRAAAPR